MALSLDTRRVRDVTFVKCSGRIAAGADCFALQQQIEHVLPREAKVVLDCSALESIDSSGLGLLVRWLTRTQTLGGNLVLYAVQPRVREVLRVTRLAPFFQLVDIEAAAVDAFQHHTVAAAAQGIGTDVLCVHNSSNVLTFVGESLRQAGYRVTTTASLSEAVMLMQAASPRVVIVATAFRTNRDTKAAETFNALLSDRVVIDLPETFASDDAGAAGAKLFAEVQRLIGSRV
ncbi:MAG TPA: STAS domain-containing protein [Vicinamibacterales bacterium]|nr:STAS domain-containing protein [Vicinamibacterales bacterium]